MIKLINIFRAYNMPLQNIYINWVFVLSVISFQPFQSFASNQFLSSSNIPTNIRFERISLEQGLSQTTVNCIIQDKKGFIWIGTQEGLNKYDGNQFKVYHHELNDKYGLSSGNILALYEDIEGIIWIGTQGGGLNKFDPVTETFTHYKYEENNENSLSENTVRVICEDRKNNLWLGTLGGGLNRFDRKNEAFKNYLHKPDNSNSISDNNVTSILEDKNGILWIGTQNEGLNYFDPDNETFIHNKYHSSNPNSISDNQISIIFEDSKNNLWIGTQNGGLNLFNQETKTFKRYMNSPSNLNSISGNSVSSIIEDKIGNLWIGIYRGGLCKIILNKNKDGFDKIKQFISYKNDITDPNSLSSNFIYSIFEDRAENLWVGTLGSGVNRAITESSDFIHYKNYPEVPTSLSDNRVWSIYKDSEDILWIGTENGLNKYNRKTKTFKIYKNEPEDPTSINSSAINSMYEDSKGNFWIGTDEGGLNKFDKKKEIFINFLQYPKGNNKRSPEYVNSIIEDSRGNLWIGSWRTGLYLYNNDSKLFTQYKNDPNNPKSLSNNQIYSIFEDSNNMLWICTRRGGLNRLVPTMSGGFHPDSVIFIHYNYDPTNSNSISNNLTRSVIEDSTGNLWISTQYGLNKFDPINNIFTRYTKKDGLPNNVLYGILDDNDNNLWISSNKGISKFNPETEIFVNYEKSDGLQSDEFNMGAFYKDNSGKMYFGGINGFNEFHPDSVNENARFDPVEITDFLLFNKSVPVGKFGIISDKFQLNQHINYTKELNLDYTDYIFSFEFSALNFHKSHKNIYKYKMDGFDNNWIETDNRNRRATYTNLNYGEYTFVVKSSNENGEWNDEITSIKVNISPPSWKSWWAYICYFLILLSLVFWLFRIQQNKAKQKQRELNQLQSIFDNTTSLMFMKNLNGCYMMINKGFEDLSNLKKNEIINKNIHEILPAKTAKEFEQNDKEVLKKNQPVEFEEQIKINDKLHTFITVRFPLYDANNKPFAVCGISTDITDRKITEEKIRTNEEYLNTTLNSIGDAVITTDIKGKIIRMNPVAENLTGWDYNEAKGKPLSKVFNIINTISKKPAINPISKVIKSGEIIGLSNHTTLISKNGIELQIADSAAPIKDNDGNINGVVLVFRDVSEEYKMREALKESSSVLKGTFESTLDGILVIDKSGKISHYNSRFKEIWTIPDEIFKNADDDSLIKFVLSQIVDPNRFVAKIKELYKSSENSEDIIHFKNGG